MKQVTPPATVFLTGGTGYIGGAVAARLVAAGYRVVGLARSAAAEAALRAAGVEPLRGDLSRGESLRQGVAAADAVVHTAQPQPVGGNMAAAVDLSVLTLRTLLDALSGTGKTLVATGGTGLFGPTGPPPADDDAPLRLPPPLAPLGGVLGEVRAAAGLGVRGVLVHPAVVYGRGGSGVGPVGPLVSAARRTGRSVYVGDGNARVATVHVDDLADLYLLALEGAEPGAALNAADNHPTHRELAEAVSRAVGLGGRAESVSAEDASRELGFVGHILSHEMRVSATRARALGWTPHRPTLPSELAAGAYTLVNA